MRLRMMTDYGIRAVIYLAQTRRIVAAAEISEQMNIPKAYFINIAKYLRNASIITTFSGIHGGYQLNMPPERISMYDIISVMESSVKIMPCAETDICPALAFYEELQSVVDETMKAVTVADILEKGSEDADGPVRRKYQRR